MARLKGQKLRFAEAIVSAKPVKISNRDAALVIGCSEGSASATGSRCMADPRVKDYIRSFWPDYFGDDSKPEDKEEGNQAVVRQQNELPLFCSRAVAEWLESDADCESVSEIAASIAKMGRGNTAVFTADGVSAWIASMDTEDSEFCAIVKAVCDKLRVSLDPVEYWEGVMMDPWATPKEKHAAASEKAKYTKAKPAAVNKKDAAREQALSLRERHRQVNAVGDFPSMDEIQGHGHVPVGGGKRWN